MVHAASGAASGAASPTAANPLQRQNIAPSQASLVRDMNQKVSDESFEALVADGKRAGKKVFLILDNLGVHHCKPVKAWLAEHQADIEVFYLPSYSPELNPDEMANADIKQAVTKLAPARTKLQLLKATARHLRSVQRQPQRIRKYFEHAPVRYAA